MRRVGEGGVEEAPVEDKHVLLQTHFLKTFFQHYN